MRPGRSVDDCGGLDFEKQSVTREGGQGGGDVEIALFGLGDEIMRCRDSVARGWSRPTAT